MNVLGHLEEIRRRLFVCLIVLIIATSLFFIKGDFLLRLARLPLERVEGDQIPLIFIGPTEAFIAYFKVCLMAGFIVAFPVILYQVWVFLAAGLGSDFKKRIFRWLVFALLLFIFGLFFSYIIALPLALNFLLNFGRDLAIPNLTIQKYFSFFLALILMGGLVFEIPVVMGLLADMRLLKSKVLRKKRHIALVVILIAAAFITPTQDIVNMLLFAVPMSLLYEVGILIARVIERKRNNNCHPE